MRIYAVEFVYNNGNLEKAFLTASKFIKRIGEDSVVTVSSNFVDDLGWTIIIVYETLESA